VPDSQATPAGKALWFIESHFADEITLDDVAQVAGVSRYHLSRLFGFATGHSVMNYVRARRLSEAARALAGGAPDILAVALDAGYSSHEAFTRAFGDQFGVTPEALRAQGNLQNIQLREPIRMEASIASLDAPRIEEGRALLIAGIGERYTLETSARIPAQWQKFAPYLGHIPGQVPYVAYGVLCNGDDQGNIDYICGMEVTDFAKIPADWSRIRIPAHKYAVFAHRDHISTIRKTWMSIYQWMPTSGLQTAKAPEFERYGREFDGRTGNGGLEIWIPIES
jgi:AraC family transcriptional regulator